MVFGLPSIFVDGHLIDLGSEFNQKTDDHETTVMRPLKAIKAFPSLPDMKAGSPKSLFSPFNVDVDENSMTP